MVIKELADLAKATPGYLGAAVYDRDRVLYNDNIHSGQAEILLGLLQSTPGARRAGAASGGATLVAFPVGNHTVVLKVAGRFPVVPELSMEEPTFVDPACAPALPSQAEARREAENALRQFGLI